MSVGLHHFIARNIRIHKSTNVENCIVVVCNYCRPSDNCRALCSICRQQNNMNDDDDDDDDDNLSRSQNFVLRETAGAKPKSGV